MSLACMTSFAVLIADSLSDCEGRTAPSWLAVLDHELPARRQRKVSAQMRLKYCHTSNSPEKSERHQLEPHQDQYGRKDQQQPVLLHNVDSA